MVFWSWLHYWKINCKICACKFIIEIVVYSLFGLIGSIRQWPGRPGFNPRSSHTKDSKMVLDDSLFNAQHYKVGINGKVDQSGENSSVLSHTLG